MSFKRIFMMQNKKRHWNGIYVHVQTKARREPSATDRSLTTKAKCHLWMFPDSVRVLFLLRMCSNTTLKQDKLTKHFNSHCFICATDHRAQRQPSDYFRNAVLCRRLRSQMGGPAPPSLDRMVGLESGGGAVRGHALQSAAPPLLWCSHWSISCHFSFIKLNPNVLK